MAVGLAASLQMKLEMAKFYPSASDIWQLVFSAVIFSLPLITFASDGKLYSFFLNGFYKIGGLEVMGGKTGRAKEKVFLFLSLVSLKELFALSSTFWLSKFSLVSGFALSLFILWLVPEGTCSQKRILHTTSCSDYMLHHPLSLSKPSLSGAAEVYSGEQGCHVGAGVRWGRDGMNFL